MDIITERTIALAGMLQACAQVQSVARKGFADTQVYESCTKSILVLDAVNTPSVYGGLAGVKLGLKMIEEGVMQSASADSMEVLRYVMTIMQLQKQLHSDPSKFQEFGAAVERLSAFEEDILAQECSKVYQTYISTMQPQVIVQGEELHLQKEDIPPKVRTLLLAALRSAVLWQQKGGSRFRLIWERTRMRNAARSLIAQV